MLRLVLIAALAAIPGISRADTADFAMGLGMVLASEKGCGLAFKQDAIAAMIERHVPADDLDFPTALAFWTRVRADQVAKMDASAKTAHCAQIERLAKSNGLID